MYIGGEIGSKSIVTYTNNSIMRPLSAVVQMLTIVATIPQTSHSVSTK